jgi:hypothetical protein
MGSIRSILTSKPTCAGATAMRAGAAGSRLPRGNRQAASTVGSRLPRGNRQTANAVGSGGGQTARRGGLGELDVERHAGVQAALHLHRTRSGDGKWGHPRLPLPRRLRSLLGLHPAFEHCVRVPDDAVRHSDKTSQHRIRRRNTVNATMAPPPSRDHGSPVDRRLPAHQRGENSAWLTAARPTHSTKNRPELTPIRVRHVCVR